MAVFMVQWPESIYSWPFRESLLSQVEKVFTIEPAKR
jgi:hypothetical protein